MCVYVDSIANDVNCVFFPAIRMIIYSDEARMITCDGNKNVLIYHIHKCEFCEQKNTWQHNNRRLVNDRT